MENGKTSQHYEMMSPEDRRTFNRWLKANAVAGLVLAAGLVAMALAGSISVGPRDAAVADHTKASDAVASEQGRKQSGVSSMRELAIRGRPF